MARMQPVWELASDPMFVCDNLGRLAWANPALAALVGSGPSVASDALLRRLTAADRELIWEAIKHHSDEGLSVRVADDRGLMLPVTVRFARLDRETNLGILLVDPEHRSDDGPRVAELETALRDITRVITGAGFVAGTDTDTRRVLPEELSGRQREVIELLFTGLGEAEIAEALHLSEHTVRNHKKAAFRRLRVHSKAELFTNFRAG